MSAGEPTHRSTLVPEKQSLALHLGCSAFFHGGAVVVLALFTLLGGVCSGEPEPLLRDTLEVSMVSLPKSETNVPDRASRAPRVQGSDPTPTPEPVVKPVQESDLAVPEPKAEPDPGTPDTSAIDDVVAQMEREKALQDLLAPEGTVDRQATDPNGVGDVALGAVGAGNPADPAYARWYAQVQQLIMKNFKPLAALTQNNPNLRCMVLIEVDTSSGQILSWRVTEPSGIPAYDAAAERAIQSTATIPLPPEAYLPAVEQGIGFRFTPP